MIQPNKLAVTLGVGALVATGLPASTEASAGQIDAPEWGTVEQRFDLMRDDFARQSQDPAWVESVQADDILFRSELGFETDALYVRSLYDNPSRSVGYRLGALFTPDEATEMAIRSDLVPTQGEIDVLMRSKYPDIYGGTWMDQPGGGLIAVHVTEPEQIPTIRQELERLLPHRERLRISDVGHSLVSLQAADQDLSRLAKAADPAIANLTSHYVNVKNNSVVVTVKPGELGDPELSEVLNSYDVPVSLSESEALFTDAGLGDVPVPPLGGGLGYYIPGADYCGIGFALRKWFLTEGWFVSAGHCQAAQPLDSKAKHDATFIGLSKGWIVSNYEDLGYVQVVNDDWIGPKVAISSTGTAFWPISQVVTEWYQGNPACLTRAWAGTVSCSTIESGSFSSGNDWDQILFNHAANEGDSGGPLFYPDFGTATAWAGGVLRATSATQTIHTRLYQITPGFAVEII